MEEITVKGYAKINLSLDVTGVRENGYHEVRMIMQSIGIYDKITVRATAGSDIKIATGSAPVPAGPDNLIYKAALKFRDYVSARPDVLAHASHDPLTTGVFINLEKRIPVAAGMAGGSTDAAATLHALNSLFDCNLSTDELCEIGVKIGADVPFCIVGGTMLSEGIGEILTPLPTAPKCHLLIVKPAEGMSTKFVYDNLVLDENTYHPDVDGMIDAIKAGSIKDVCAKLGNILESVTIKHVPAVQTIKDEMIALGALGSLMSGSGSTVFGIFNDKKTAEAAYYKFKVGEFGKQTYLTELV